MSRYKKNNAPVEEVVIPEEVTDVTISGPDVDLTQSETSGQVTQDYDNEEPITLDENDNTPTISEPAQTETGKVIKSKEQAIEDVKHYLYMCRSKHPSSKTDGKMNAVYIIERDRGQKVYFNFPSLSSDMMLYARSLCKGALSREEFILLVIKEMNVPHPRFYTGVDIVKID